MRMLGKSEHKLFKRKLSLCIPVILVLFASITVGSFYLNRQVDSKSFNQTLEGISLMIDAGHGGFDPGSIGSATGVKESILNLAVARYLRAELTARGAKVNMTRAGNGALAKSKREDMERRKKLIEKDIWDASISIHMNKYTTPRPKGPIVFYYKNSLEGEMLAQTVQNALDDELRNEQRSAATGDYMVLRSGNTTSILVECGFLSNPNDEMMLQNEDHQKALASAIAQGIENYFVNIKDRDNADHKTTTPQNFVIYPEPVDPAEGKGNDTGVLSPLAPNE